MSEETKKDRTGSRFGVERIVILDLARCPFCNGSAVVLKGGGKYIVRCKNDSCAAILSGFQTEGLAVKAWNSRNVERQLATGGEISDAGNIWLTHNKNHSVPYSMTDGFWNVLVGMLRQWGFIILKGQ